MNRFLVVPRVRRGEFCYAILDTKDGSERAKVMDELDAYSIVAVMNANELTPDRVAAVEIASRESFRPHWLNVKEAIRQREMRV